MQSNFKCEHCSSTFVKEKTLFVHLCEQKRRHLAKSEKHVRLALLTFQKFYKLTQNQKTDKTYDDFRTSPFYTSFVKFGSFVLNTNPIYPERFIEYVISSGVKLDHWCRDELYDKYIFEITKKEPVDDAIKRTISTMMDWADKNNAQWEHYFKYVNHNRVTHDIKEGLISPWILLNSSAGTQLLQTLNDEQLEIVGAVMDLNFWKQKFKSSQDDMKFIKDLIKETNIL